jgi:acyl-CoA hydrolase
VHWVVTEYGITDLFGRNLKQRAQALINLAHPGHREELDRAVYERFYKTAASLKLKAPGYKFETCNQGLCIWLPL